MSLTENETAISDPELISRVRAGDLDAYGELFSRHKTVADRLARTLTGGAEADDLVSDAFNKVLNVLMGGGGPDVAFRAYLLTSVRRLHIDKIRAAQRAMPTDDLAPFDQGEEFADPAITSFEGGAAAKAFSTLPERWQLVLWHLEVENQKPADIAPLLGMSANSVSALAYRAREGLRQAFLNQHALSASEEVCKETQDHLGAYVRGGLSKRDTAKVEDHLEECRKCTAAYLEIADVNNSIAAVLGPALLGTAAVGYLGTTAGVGGGIGALTGRLRESVGGNGAVVAAATAVIAGTAVAGTVVAVNQITKDNATRQATSEGAVSDAVPGLDSGAGGGSGSGAGGGAGNQSGDGSGSGAGSGSNGGPDGAPIAPIGPQDPDSSTSPSPTGGSPGPSNPGPTGDPSNPGPTSGPSSPGSTGGPSNPGSTSGPTSPGPTGGPSNPRSTSASPTTGPSSSPPSTGPTATLPVTPSASTSTPPPSATLVPTSPGSPSPSGIVTPSPSPSGSSSPTSSSSPTATASSTPISSATVSPTGSPTVTPTGPLPIADVSAKISATPRPGLGFRSDWKVKITNLPPGATARVVVSQDTLFLYQQLGNKGCWRDPLVAVPTFNCTAEAGQTTFKFYDLLPTQGERTLTVAITPVSGYTDSNTDNDTVSATYTP